MHGTAKKLWNAFRKTIGPMIPLTRPGTATFLFAAAGAGYSRLLTLSASDAMRKHGAAIYRFDAKGDAGEIAYLFAGADQAGMASSFFVNDYTSPYYREYGCAIEHEYAEWHEIKPRGGVIYSRFLGLEKSADFVRVEANKVLESFITYLERSPVVSNVHVHIAEARHFKSELLQRLIALSARGVTSAVAFDSFEPSVEDFVGRPDVRTIVMRQCCAECLVSTFASFGVDFSERDAKGMKPGQGFYVDLAKKKIVREDFYAPFQWVLPAKEIRLANKPIAA